MGTHAESAKPRSQQQKLSPTTARVIAATVIESTKPRSVWSEPKDSKQTHLLIILVITVGFAFKVWMQS